jgi:sRNA-binding regulator protein Hfq
MGNPPQPNPYWQKALQYQQQGQQGGEQRNQGRQQQQRQQQQRQQENKPRDFGGFDSLVVDRECMIKLGNGEVIKGLVSAASKYFYLVNAGGQVTIVNKAYVVLIMPIQTPQQNNTNNNGTGGSNGENSPRAR